MCRAVQLRFFYGTDAGCPGSFGGLSWEIVMCTPPGKEEDSPAILYAARETGVDRILKLGGVQAIGAMAFGTESVPQV